LSLGIGICGNLLAIVFALQNDIVNMKIYYFIQQYMDTFASFHNKRIAILGYGKEGQSTLNFFLHIGVLPKYITILDGADHIEGLAKQIVDIDHQFGVGSRINIIVGTSYLDTLHQFDIIVKTPWISLYHEKIYPHRKKITSQAQIFFDYYQGKIIAITWTKWKSTTATLTYEVLKAAQKKVQLLGNIGHPMLDALVIDDLASQQDEYTVCEISSYMLEGLIKKNYISIVLNIYPDHLDWHKGWDNYQKAKFSILYGSEHNLVRYEILDKNKLASGDFIWYNVRIFGKQWMYTYKPWDFFIDTTKVFDDGDILLKWEHNMLNICSVLGVCDIMHISPLVLKEVLKNFNWLPHRLENLWMHGGIVRVDDAISTTPESTIQAIHTLGDAIDTIFLWGKDRGYDFKELAKIIKKSQIRNVVLFPDSWEKIHTEIKKYDLWEIQFFKTNDMKEAVRFAYEHTKDKKICLLSTASPSYSVRKNFEEKWDLFKQYIKELA